MSHDKCSVYLDGYGFQQYAMLHLQNRAYTKALETKTPYQSWKGKNLMLLTYANLVYQSIF